MDKLTAIKIKYDDGTYSDEIPVSVLSENVEWDNTHTLVDVLGSIDVDVTGTIQDQISQLFNEKVSNSDMQNYVSSSMPTYITNWLNTNVNPVGSAVVVDSSLTISGAAADAKVVGDLKNILNNTNVSCAIAQKTSIELSFTIEFNQTIENDIIVSPDNIITITTDNSGNNVSMGVHYADGTSKIGLRVYDYIIFRPEKTIVKINFYSDASRTITIKITPSDKKALNLFDQSLIEPGYISGASIVGTNYFHSDYMECVIGDTLYTNTYPVLGLGRVYFYDKDKNYLGQLSGTLQENGLYAIPLTLNTIGNTFVRGIIAYARINVPSELEAKTMMYCLNENPDSYLAYGEQLPDANLGFNTIQKTYIKDKNDETLATVHAETAEVYTHETSVNLFDYKTSEFGKFWQGGTKHDLANYVVSNPIKVSVGDVLLYSVTSRGQLYNSFGEYIDSEGNALQVINQNNTTETEEGYLKLVSTRDCYVQFNSTNSYYTNLMIVKNIEMPNEYVPYKDKYVFTDKVASGSEPTLEGKRILYNGDSICESRLNAGTSYNGGAYAKIIADETDGYYVNYGISGGILASAVPSGTMPHSVVNSLASMSDTADIICFEGGINDYWRSVPLGEYDESDYSGTLDTATICGALESIFRQATTKWVGKPIVFVIVHKIKSTVYVANSAGYTFAQAREKMIGICNKYAIPYYDAFAESGLNAYNDIQNTTFLTSNSTGNPDGCHPNEAAYRRYYVPQLIALFGSLMPKLEE